MECIPPAETLLVCALKATLLGDLKNVALHNPTWINKANPKKDGNMVVATKA